MNSVLETGIRNVRNVDRFIFGEGAIDKLDEILSKRRNSVTSSVVFLIDEYFERNPNRMGTLPCAEINLITLNRDSYASIKCSSL